MDAQGQGQHMSTNEPEQLTFLWRKRAFSVLWGKHLMKLCEKVPAAWWFSRVRGAPLAGVSREERGVTVTWGAHLKCAEPFLQAAGGLDGGDAPPLLALAVGRPDGPERGGSARVRDKPCGAARRQDKKHNATSTCASRQVVFSGCCTEITPVYGHQRPGRTSESIS